VRAKIGTVTVPKRSPKTIGEMLEDPRIVQSKAHKSKFGNFVSYKICAPQDKPSRRLRFSFGRHGASPLPWTCTRSELMAGVLTEECDRVAEARAKVSYNPIGVQMILDQRRKLTTRANARQGWDKHGEVIG